MAYAFENTPWHKLPLDEQIAIAIMQAQIRDNAMTVNERYAQYAATIGMKKETGE